jgi:hypothetical protein
MEYSLAITIFVKQDEHKMDNWSCLFSFYLQGRSQELQLILNKHNTISSTPV